MKSALGFILSLFVIVGCNTTGRNIETININGVWEDSNSVAFQNAVLILSDNNGEINMSHYLEWKGQKFLEYGKGSRTGNTIIYDTEVTIPINGWASKGTHQLVLSEDGQTLRGTYSDNMGKSGPIVFKKVR